MPVKLVVLEPRGRDLYDIRVVEALSSHLAPEGEGFKLVEGASVKTLAIQRSLRGAKNAAARAARTAATHSAPLISDGAAVRALLDADPPTVEVKKPPKDPPKRTPRRELPPEPDEEEGGGPFGRALVGDPPHGFAGASSEADDDDDDEGEEVEVDDESGDDEEVSEPPTPELDEEDLDVEVMALGFRARDVKNFTPESKRTIYRDKLTPDRIRILPKGEIEVIVIAPPPEPEPEPEPVVIPPKPPRAYKLVVWKYAWPDGRFYNAGQSGDREEVENAAKMWEKAGFKSRIEELPAHHRAGPPKYTLNTEPIDPILCAVPNCPWVGDHLGPHLSAHGIDLANYRTIYKYKGPAIVGRAVTALERAHESTRRAHDIRLGMFLVEIRGDADGDIWKIDGIKDDKYDLSWVCGRKEKRDETISGAELLSRMLPVSRWARRVQKEME